MASSSSSFVVLTNLWSSYCIVCRDGGEVYECAYVGTLRSGLLML